jgi:hypothetical protein
MWSMAGMTRQFSRRSMQRLTNGMCDVLGDCHYEIKSCSKLNARCGVVSVVSVTMTSAFLTSTARQYYMCGSVATTLLLIEQHRLKPRLNNLNTSTTHQPYIELLLQLLTHDKLPQQPTQCRPSAPPFYAPLCSHWLATSHAPPSHSSPRCGTSPRATPATRSGTSPMTAARHRRWPRTRARRPAGSSTAPAAP